ncbi:MAG: UBP-type zinc finger domain-containing protein [Acidobacteriota bacterium]
MACHHFEGLKPVPSAAASYKKGCPECIAMGDTWVHLRECLVCGHVGCCDSSKNKHATKHFHTSKHAVMRSVEPGESWGYCYVDDVMVELD